MCLCCVVGFKKERGSLFSVFKQLRSTRRRMAIVVEDLKDSSNRSTTQRDTYVMDS